MIFEPQIPKWGLIEFEQYKEKLINYHNWLYTTGIKTGLITKKSQPVSYTHLRANET